MYPAPDMSLWQGRIDSQEGADARRWHQWMRPYADDAEAASVLLGFASDEGVRRNQGRQGARHGPPALRRALANLAWHGEQAIYDAATSSPATIWKPPRNATRNASPTCSRAATGWSDWAAATKSPTPASPASPAT